MLDILDSKMQESKMSSTSQKHRRFVSEPMRERSVRDLPGVGETLGQRLESKGINKANAVFGQYLVLNKDKASFQNWMLEKCNANSKQSGDCYDALNNWAEEFM